MRQKIGLVSMGLLLLLLTNVTIFALAIPPQPGKIVTFQSQNGRYSVSIKILGYPDGSPSECTFMDSGKTIWSKRIDTTPSKVAIADNGQCIAMTNWGWYDEGASGSLSLYNNMGELIKEIPFGGQFNKGLKWVRFLVIAPDGSFCVLGEDLKEHALFTVYDCHKGVSVWGKSYGLPDAVMANLNNNGEYILIATKDYYSGNMQFFLLGHNGQVLFNKTILNNFSWDVPEYLRFNANGREFEIFDYNSGKFLVEPLPIKGGN